jgi:hypothetical protein
MTGFIEWVPKHHGHQPLYWTPNMLTSVDGKNFARQPNWAWIAGSVYYVPREAVGLPRIEPEPAQTDADRIEALTAENERLLKTALWLGKYSCHDDECQVVTHGVWSDPIPCTCGYTDAWQALAALEKQP